MKTDLTEAINILTAKSGTYKWCLDKKDWASSGDDYHKECRRDYRKRMTDLNKAIKILKVAEKREK